MAAPDFYTYRAQNRTLDYLEAFYSSPFNLTGVPDPQRVPTLIVSSGPQHVAVPPVEGLDEQNARTQIEGAGLAVQISDQQVANPGQDGIVLSQSPGSGTQVDPGSTVSLVVGRFREPEIPGDDG